MGEFDSGSSRLMKVLVRVGDSADGHRAYPVAWNESKRQWVAVAATEGPGFTWGRLYSVAEETADHHPYVLEEVSSVPHEDGWKLAEDIIDKGAGHEDPY